MVVQPGDCFLQNSAGKKILTETNGQLEADLTMNLNSCQMIH